MRALWNGKLYDVLHIDEEQEIVLLVALDTLGVTEVATDDADLILDPSPFEVRVAFGEYEGRV